MTSVHLSSYLVFTAVTIAVFVFLNAEQPFVITSIFHKAKSAGTIASVLALVDELTNICCSPFWGALSDKIGTRYVAVAGLFFLSSGVYMYPHAGTVYPGLILVRIWFSCGASACVSMITAMLAEYTTTFVSLERTDIEVETAASIGFAAVPLLAQEYERGLELTVNTPRNTGKIAGLVGVASGVGAVLSVSLLLPLPTQLGYEEHPALAITKAFQYVGLGVLFLSVVLFFTLYQHQAKGFFAWIQGRDLSVFEEAALDISESQSASYSELLAAGFGAAQTDKSLQLAYAGSAVSRAASVATTLFIPLMVNSWYYSTGKCLPGKGCREAVVLAAILTGVANLASLLGAPVWGYVVDRTGATRVLFISSVMGALSMMLWVLLPSPQGARAILISLLMGVASVGVMTESMALCTTKRRDFSGSVAGVYSLCGGIGLLVLTQIGGPIADIWAKAPFVVLGVLYSILSLVSF